MENEKMSRKNIKQINENIVLICNDCIEKRKQDVKYDYEIGDYVKYRFKDKEGTGELMWIKIISIHKNEIDGILDNEPIFIKYLELGDLVTIKKKDIIQIMYKWSIKK